MRSSFPQTIDVSANPIGPVTEAVDATATAQKTRAIRTVINQSLGADAFLLVGSLLLGIVCSGAINSVEIGTELQNPLLKPLPWFVFLVCGLPSLVFLLIDTLRASHSPTRMPFAYAQSKTKNIYAKRLHLALGAVYFAAILVAFCWSVPSMLLFSKLFVSAVFAIALYALGQSITSRRKSFVVTGLIFLIVLIAAQIFAMARL